MILTKNEKKVLRFLAVSTRKDYSINDIAKACKLAPNGAYKLLAKLEEEEVLRAELIGNIKSYKLNLENEKAVRVLEFAFLPDAIKGRLKSRADDLEPLKAVTNACIFFGSYITTKKEPGDLDILFILEQKNFIKYKKILSKVQDVTPVKIQDVVQTVSDLEQNLKKDDPIVITSLREGVVLWGFNILVEVIKSVSR